RKLALTELAAHDAPERARRAAGCECGERKWWDDVRERLSDDGGCLRELARAGGIVAEEPSGQPQRTDVGRAGPDRAFGRRADDELRGASPDIADRNGLRQVVRSGDRAKPRQG